MPLVSILIPVHNHEAYIEGCVRSALAQTFTDVEVVVSDNASSDGTAEICRTLARADQRVRFFSNPANVGPTRNCKLCAERAVGGFAVILFSDDLLAPAFLEELLPLLEASDVGFAYSAVTTGRTPWMGPPLNTWGTGQRLIPSSGYIVEALQCGDVPVSPCGVLLRREDLLQSIAVDIPSPTFHDFPEHFGGPDLLTLLRVAASYRFVARVNQALAFFRHGGRLTKTLGGGKGHRRYLQARIQYALEANEVPTLQDLLAEAWLLEIWRQRSFVGPATASRLYCDRTVPLPWGSITSAGARLVRMRLRRLRARGPAF